MNRVFLCVCIFLEVIHFTKGQATDLKGTFTRGNVNFTWTLHSPKDSISREFVYFKADDEKGTYEKVTRFGYYMKMNILKYKNFSIKVVTEMDDLKTVSSSEYKVFKIPKVVQATEGDNTSVEIPIDFIPATGSYTIQKGAKLFDVTEDNAKSEKPEKYIFVKKEAKKSITIKIINVTTEDAGYISTTGGQSNPNGPGVVLVVKGKPTKPVIKGTPDVQVGQSTILTCQSQSTSAPSYYKMLPPLTYTWYSNDSVINRSSHLTLNVKKSDKYNDITCSSRQTIDSDRSETYRLNLLYGPDRVNIRPVINNTINVTEGKSFGPYNCSADCKPPCRYQWEKQTPGSQYVKVVSGQTFNISSVDKANATKYRCRVESNYTNSNGSKTASKIVTLNVLYGPDMVKISPEIKGPVEVIKGNRFGPYNCSADCYPPCRYQWEKHNGSQYVDAGTGPTFSISSVDKANANKYICRVYSDNNTFNGPSKVSKTIIVRVLYGPDMVKIYPDIQNTEDVIVGESFGPYNCTADCNPPCRYQWQKHNGSQYIDVGTGPTFEFSSVDKADANKYRCRVDSGHKKGNGLKKFTKIVTLRVLYGPDTVNISPEVMETVDRIKGESFGPFNCSADCNPRCRYQWEKHNGSQYVYVGTGQTFTISSVDKDNANKYRCRVDSNYTNSYGNTTVTKTVILRVLYGPDAVNISPEVKETVDVIEGETFGPYRCLADCNPPCRYQWKKHNGSQYVDVGTGQTFSILSANKTDANKYRCQVDSNYTNSNGSTEATKTITLRVLYGPDTAKISPEIQTTVYIIEGERFGPYNCSADCNPPCKYQWKKHKSGSKYDDVGNGQTFNISFVQKDDAKKYRCRVDYKNFNGSYTVITTVTLRVLYGPDTVNISPEIQDTLDVIEGNSFGPYNCSADCYPPCRYQWEKHNGSQYVDAGTGPTFSISSVNKTDAKKYRCRVDSDYKYSNRSKNATKTVTLRVLYGPDTVRTSPEIQYTLDVIEGNSFGPINCSADCYPPCNYQWEKHNGSQYVDVGTGATFNIPFVNKADANTYRCRVDSNYKYSNRSKNATKTITLRVLYGPDTVNISPEIQDTLDVIEGNSFGPYNCSADCYPQCRYHWEKHNGSQYVDVGMGPTFSISSVNKTDAKKYRCRVDSNYKYSNRSKNATKTVTLRVLYISEPDVYTDNVIMKSQTFEEKVRMNLSCRVEGVPQTWVSILRDRNTLSTGKEWSNYTFSEGLQCIDTGNYTCTGNSSHFSQNEKSFLINVHCSARLDDTSSLKSLYGSHIGQNISVYIPVISNPKPKNLTWTKPANATIQTTIEQGSVVYRHNIESKIHIREQSDFGNYTLFVEDKQITVIKIDAEGPPFQPSNFSGISEMQGQINLTWISTFNGGPEQFFLLKQKINSEWLQIENISDLGQGRQMWFVVDKNIEAGVTYEFMLQSCNRINCSDVIRSAPIKTQEKPTGNSGSPVTVEVSSSVAGVVVLAAVLAVVICRIKRRSKEGTQTGVPCSPPEVVYATVDKGNVNNPTIKGNIPVTKKESNDMGTGIACSPSEVVYAIVDKGNVKSATVQGNKKEANDIGVDEHIYTNTNEAIAVIKKDKPERPANSTKKKKKTDRKKKTEKTTSTANNTSRTVNEEGLIYIDVDFAKTPQKTQDPPVIHGEEDRTEYTFVDFSKKAPPMEGTSGDQENEKKKDDS